MMAQMRKSMKSLYALTGIALLAAFCILPAPKSLEQAAAEMGAEGWQAMRALGCLMWAAVWWIGKVFYDWVVAILMAVLWCILGCSHVQSAFSAFSGTTIWTLIGAFMVTGAIQKSGLLAHLSRWIFSQGSATYRGRTAMTILMGVVCSPLIPSVTAKTVIGTEMVDTLVGREEPKGGNERYGLFLSAWTGSGLAAAAFLNGSTTSYTVLGAMPETVRTISVVEWSVAASPWLFIMCAGMWSYIQLRFPGWKDGANTEKIKTDKNLSGQEKKSALVLGICLLFWSLEGSTGVQTVLVSLLGGTACFALGLLDKKDLGTVIPWDLVLFIGAVLGIGPVFESTGVNLWIQTVSMPLFSRIETPAQAVLILAVSVYLLRFILASQTASIVILLTMFSPIAAKVGMHPFVAGFIIYVVGQTWTAPYQNVVFLTACSAGGDIPHRAVSRACMIYELLTVAACFASIPLWRAMGLII